MPKFDGVSPPFWCCKNPYSIDVALPAALTLSVRRAVLNFVADPIENPHGMSRKGWATGTTGTTTGSW
jgi:hypothetical protein